MERFREERESHEARSAALREEEPRVEAELARVEKQIATHWS
jgi:hypothetical protein